MRVWGRGVRVVGERYEYVWKSENVYIRKGCEGVEEGACESVCGRCEDVESKPVFCTVCTRANIVIVTKHDFLRMSTTSIDADWSHSQTPSTILRAWEQD